jgi:hypothetical protein
MKHHTIVSTNWTKGKKGMEYPFRYVVLARVHDNGELKEFSRHMEVRQPGLPKGEKAYYHGHYYQHLKHALDDLTKTLKEHKMMFPTPSNQSHIAGGVNIYNTKSAQKYLKEFGIKG